MDLYRLKHSSILLNYLKNTLNELNIGILDFKMSIKIHYSLNLEIHS